MTGPTKPRLGEFAEQIGETQRHGSKRVYGHALPASTPGQPVQLAVQTPLQVASVFETRPVDAYDFAFDSVREMGDDTIGGGPFEDAIEVPAQYTLALTAVELDFSPPYIFSTDGTTRGQFWLLRNGIRIPNATLNLRSSYSVYRWPVYHVFGPTDTLGLSSFIDQLEGNPPSWPGGMVTVRYFGTLMLSHGRRPQAEVGSPPMFVRGVEPK